ncbi:type II toxin-antitoxin system VapC family toxin [Gemmatimonas sp.]|uniref:type II toxin-antitoxin system VapC family toxin n=1 Tax=Gemmatimonas sp. TaxID=1962908 RepID=UPI00356964CE
MLPHVRLFFLTAARSWNRASIAPQRVWLPRGPCALRNVHANRTRSARSYRRPVRRWRCSTQVETNGDRVRGVERGAGVVIGRTDRVGRARRAARGGAVVTSALTGVECARALMRARVLGRITHVEELAALQLLDRAESSWDVYALTDGVLERARATMSVDPVRMLDALHVATASALRDAVGPVAVLSLDERVRSCARALGFVVVPEQ